MKNFATYLTHPVFAKVSEIAHSRNTRAFVIGGYVRDLILQRPSKTLTLLLKEAALKLPMISETTLV